MRRLLLDVAAFPLVTGCSSIVQGIDQSVAVMTEPAGASCNVTRDGDLLGTVYPTPGVLSIDKAKGNIMVEREHDGFERTIAVLPARFEGAIWGNLLLGLDGAGIDAVSGAMHRYPNSIMVRMKPEAPQTAQR